MSLLTGNLLLADVVLLDKDGTRVFKASIAEVKNQGCPVGGLAVSTGTFWQTWFHLLTTDPEHVDSGLVQLDENAVVDLPQPEQLENLLHLGGHLQDKICKLGQY